MDRSPPASRPPIPDALALAARRLAWLDRRQAVLAQNVANADTPAWRPRDLLPFDQVLAGQRQRLAMARTEAGHGAGRPDPAGGLPMRTDPVEVAPDGNGVSLDREALRIAETESAHAFAVAVHRGLMGMVRTALGR